VAAPVSVPAARSRKWLFRASAALLPLLALLVLELGLRLGGYGFSTCFFKPLRIGEQSLLVENDAFGRRFFPRDMARMPLTLRMAPKKPPGAYRIFIFGESAAMGDPEPAFGAARYLTALLEERFPQARFEVVNTAMTAINSHAILPIARDCARHQGDLWILYIGNNEMVGPFGAATVFGLKAPPLPLVRGYLAFQELRAGQLLLDLCQKLRGGPQANSWEGMKMFLGNQLPPDAAAREVVYRNFQENLQDIAQTGLDSGARVLLSTVPVNLKDCPPFASMHSVGVSSANCAACDTSYREGCLAEQRGNFVEAAQQFEQAAKLDPFLAELQYQWAIASMKSSRFDAAREHFQRACDYDALPFRATSRINEIIRQTANGKGTSLLDADVAFTRYDLEPDSVGRIVPNPPRRGEDTAPHQHGSLFYEHVHLNFDGNYRLALAWADGVEKFLPASFRNQARAQWASQERCEQRLGLTEWDRLQAIEGVIGRRQRPPLAAQANNEIVLNELSNQSATLKRAMESGDVRTKAKNTYVEALRVAPGDYFVRENFAEFLEATGELNPATEQWQSVRQLIPQDHAPLYRLGRLAAAQGELTQAKELLEQTVAMRPSFAPGWFELGSVWATTRNYPQAITAFDQALRFDPQNANYWFCDGLALAMAGRRAEAIQHYRQAARLDPADWKAHFELGGLLGQDGNMAEAKAESEVAVRLNPAFPTSRLNLGLALVKLGSLDEAERQFEETLRLEPGNSRATDYLAQVRALKNDAQK
jgi:tetratricopeptide (TPR) repeat protein